jgi:lipid-binding SYLF domain-containing protein
LIHINPVPVGRSKVIAVLAAIRQQLPEMDMNSRKWIIGLFAVTLALPFGGALAQSKGDSNEAKRVEIRKMASDTLAQLYKVSPEARGKIEKAAGYGVFSNFGITIVFLGGAGGKGMVHDNASKKVTYMNMGQAQAGLGIGATKYKAVFIFKDAKTLQTFVDKGLELGAQGGVAAKAGKSGAADTTGTSIHPGIEIIQLTETGAIAGVTLAGTKYWKDGDLN